MTNNNQNKYVKYVEIDYFPGHNLPFQLSVEGIVISHHKTLDSAQKTANKLKKSR